MRDAQDDSSEKTQDRQRIKRIEQILFHIRSSASSA
jgi:hypothetical protein